MNTPFNFTGYVRPSAPTPEKIKTLSALGAPASYVTDITPFKLPQNIFMQNQMPSCVAHTVTWMVMYAWWKKTGNVVKLSPRFVYALCKTIDGLAADAGTTYQAAFKIIEEYGICEDSFFPNDTTLDVTTYSNPFLISPEAKTNALQYKAVGSFLSDLSVGGLQEAVYQHGVVGIGTEVSDYWWTPDWQDVLPLKPYDASHPIVSGHAVALYAYGMPWDGDNPTNFWGMNWWSPQWGYKGRFCYGANYEPTVYEAVVVELANTTSTPVQAQTVSVESPLEKLVDNMVEVVEKVL